VPVADPIVAVNEPATAGTVIVPEPDVSPVRTTELIISPYRMTQLLPDGTVTVTPLAIDKGPTVLALNPVGIV
jgi:hypothetical protein